MYHSSPDALDMGTTLFEIASKSEFFGSCIVEAITTSLANLVSFSMLAELDISLREVGH